MSGNISKKAEQLHLAMIQRGNNAVFDQNEMGKISDVGSSADLMKTIQELINFDLVKPVKQGDTLKFKAVKQSEAEKLSKMTKDEGMVYSYIEASGREGIWTKTIKAKTNLHQHIVARCLKSLEGQSFIKAIKSVKYPTRKIYMLYNLTPSIDVTGGPWFTDSELDTEFIESLVMVIWRFVASKSYPNPFNKRKDLTNLPTSNPPQQSFPATFSDYPSVDDILAFIEATGIVNVEISTSDIRSLCDVLVYDEKLELVDQASATYKATWQSILENGGGHSDIDAIYTVQDDVAFSIFDNYRVIQDAGVATTVSAEDQAMSGVAAESPTTSKEAQKSVYYLDSYISL